MAGLSTVRRQPFSRLREKVCAQRRMRVMQGRAPSLARPSSPAFSRKRERGEPAHAAFGSEPLACSTIAANAAGSVMARSDSTLRSTSMPAVVRPEIKRL